MTPMGDAAWRFHLPAGASPAGVLASLRRVYGVVDAVVADGVALVCFDPALPPNEADLRACLSERECAREIPPREHVIRARYDGDDLGSVAVMCGVAPERVVEMHASRWYTVQVVGFLPGFGYLGPLCEMLA